MVTVEQIPNDVYYYAAMVTVEQIPVDVYC